ncbi:DNA-binding transcriptional regulator, LysR family [Rhodospirillales bacterium URHD0017]|nr:DNA-binding transcriptional regulator, LysR family [Rhodospirillales bacterium URHD0017]
MAALDGSGLEGHAGSQRAATPTAPANGRTMDWDDVRVFLAVVRHGSLRAAGRALGLSQPTIARRLAAFEATFGPTLFDRLPDGARLNAAGERLVPAAESVEQAVLSLERRRAAASAALSGTVRVSTGECAAGFLARCLAGSTATALPSGITLELVASRPANLARREADLALRHEPPDSGDFYICKLGSFACAVYRRRGKNADAWVTYTESQANFEPARWVRQQVAGTQDAVALRASSMLMHLEAIVAGTGRGVLPCYVGDGHPLLERLTAPIAELAAEYWMVVHRDVRRGPCVRAVIDWMKQVFAEQRDVITGVARDPVADQRPTRSTKGKRRDRTARPPLSRRAKDRPALRSQ